MPPLFPPDYPFRADAPLLSLGPSFSEEISRSVIAAVWRENDERPHEADVRVAASLTMLEAFHPRDHLECMLAAQGVACHAAIMECYHRAMHAETQAAEAIKLRANVAQLSRTFSVLLHDLERRQAKPLPQRPPEPPPTEQPRPPDDRPPPEGHAGSPPLDALPEQPEDVVVRPDGTPGTLAAYAPRAPEEVFVAEEPPIMMALATRPKPWRMVNAASPAAPPPPVGPAEGPPAASGTRGPLDMMEGHFSGDALARFASARFDPDTPVEPLVFEEDGARVELELISTGGDPDAEAERAALAAAHPEGKPIVTVRYGRSVDRDDPPDGA